MNNKLTSIEGKRESRSELKQALDQLLSNFKEYKEFYEVRAELKKNYYDHLVKQGFTKEQALDIVKSDTTL